MHCSVNCDHPVVFHCISDCFDCWRFTATVPPHHTRIFELLFPSVHPILWLHVLLLSLVFLLRRSAPPCGTLAGVCAKPCVLVLHAGPLAFSVWHKASCFTELLRPSKPFPPVPTSFICSDCSLPSAPGLASSDDPRLPSPS